MKSSTMCFSSKQQAWCFMGWKTFKKVFKVGHLVTLHDGFIHIGSGYVNDLVRINMSTGAIIQNSTFDNFLRDNYPNILEATPQDILATINVEDEFSNSIPVYTYNSDCVIVEKLCEETGWPNVTHDGQIMYENTFFSTKEVAAKQCEKETLSMISFLSVSIEDLEEKKRNLQFRFEKFNQSLSDLHELYPQK
jgi:hypothetical protein